MVVLPINDTEPNRYSSIPIMTLLLIAVNIVVMVCALFLWQYVPLYRLYGSVPHFILTEVGGGALSSITSTFIHGDIFHLVGNMLILWIFGRRVEDACGPWRFLVFYLFCGLCADLLSTLIRHQEAIPGIGASGAIAGLLGAYLILFPGGRIRTLFLFVMIPFVPRIRAFWYVLYWLAYQFIPVYQILVYDLDYSVNYWAHLGGFFSSLFVIFYLRPEAFARFLSNEPV
jgi:membrane associated rhomboid family serine protease